MKTKRKEENRLRPFPRYFCTSPSPDFVFVRFYFVRDRPWNADLCADLRRRRGRRVAGSASRIDGFFFKGRNLPGAFSSSGRVPIDGVDHRGAYALQMLVSEGGLVA